jgi:hypothetical protein
MRGLCRDRCLAPRIPIRGPPVWMKCERAEKAPRSIRWRFDQMVQHLGQDFEVSRHRRQRVMGNDCAPFVICLSAQRSAWRRTASMSSGRTAGRHHPWPSSPPRRRAATAFWPRPPGCARGIRRRRNRAGRHRFRPSVDCMRRYPGETRAGCEPPSRRTLQSPRSPGPTACGSAPSPAPCASARFRPAVLVGVAHYHSARGGEGWECELERSARPASDSTQIRPPWRSTISCKSPDRCPYREFRFHAAFEHAEHPVGVLRIDTDSVVAHRKQPPFPSRLRRDMDSRGFLASVLDRIGNEVLEKLHQQNLFGYHGRQWIGSYYGAALRDGRLEIEQRLGENRAAIDRGELPCSRSLTSQYASRAFSKASILRAPSTE